MQFWCIPGRGRSPHPVQLRTERLCLGNKITQVADKALGETLVEIPVENLVVTLVETQEAPTITAVAAKALGAQVAAQAAAQVAVQAPKIL